MENAYINLWSRLREIQPKQTKQMFSRPEVEDLSETGPRACYQRGLLDYTMAEHYQRESHVSNLPKQILELAFAKLPKLRHVRMGDFRNLAAIGETPEKLCERLFGIVLWPEFRHINSEHRNNFTDFHFLLEMCCNRDQADLQSISLGGHRYCPYSSEHSGIDNFDHCPAIAFDADFDLLLTDKTAFEKLGNLKSLQLPLNIVQTIHARHMTQVDFVQYCQKSSFVKPLLEACSSSLTSLELTAEGTGLITISRRDRHADEARLEKSASFLIQVPFSMRFASLRYLEVCGRLFTEHAIKGFLLRMKSTLRELRLLDNLIMDNSERLALWGGGNLLLEGVQIANLDHSRDSRPYINDLEVAWLASRHNTLTPRALSRYPRNGEVGRRLLESFGSAEWVDDLEKVLNVTALQDYCRHTRGLRSHRCVVVPCT